MNRQSQMQSVAVAVTLHVAQDIREYAREKGLDAQAAIEEGLQEKAWEFRAGGSQIYR